jgi:hypothetical protein
MNIRRLAAALAIGASAAAVACTTASAAPPPNGCPAGFDLLSVQTLTAEGYKLPARIDSPTSGLDSFGKNPGNGDGYICGRSLGNRLTDFGLPLYEFTDNGLPAA